MRYYVYQVIARDENGNPVILDEVKASRVDTIKSQLEEMGWQFKAAFKL